jgi:2-methylisocitrate lyase-like PEP mutase family enzyme
VAEYEAAGVAGIHLEDQVAPKRCGHLEGKQVVPAAVMVDKIRAAVAARGNPDFVLIARTDALAVEGLSAAVDRALRYREAGADVVFVEAPSSEAEIEQVAERLRGVPLLFNWAEGGKTPPMSLDRLAELGFAIVICPLTALLAATHAVRGALARLRHDGTPTEVMRGLPGLPEFVELVGMGEIADIGEEYGNG